MKNRVLAILAVAVLAATSASAVVYVNQATGDDANPGNGWGAGQAVATIQRGIDIAFGIGGDEVWVAQGVYNEFRTEAWGAPASVTGSLVLKSNVHLYGGFDGTETLQSERAPLVAPTIIDGSVARSGLAAYHVVVAGTNSAPSDNVVLDGFTIRGGAANGVGGDYHTWRGGGLFNWQSDLIVRNCIFTSNSAAVSGGAIANEGNGLNRAQSSYENCLIYQNTAERLLDSAGNQVRGGGGIFVDVSDPSIIHCTIADNAILNLGLPPLLMGLTGGGIYIYNSNVTVEGCVVWGNTANSHLSETFGAPGGFTFGYSDLQVAVGGTNISANPQFNNVPFPRMLTLATSPCVDAASPAPVLLFDIGLVPRPIFGRTALRNDMGCYEMSPIPPSAVCQAHTVQLDSSGNGSMVVGDIDGGSTAEASIWRRTASQTAFTCAHVGVNNVTLTVSDRIGRSANCSAAVTVEDNVDPVAVCQPHTVQLDSGGNGSMVDSDIDGGSTDACGIATLVASQTAFTCAHVGVNNITLTVTDNNGNSSQCVAQVTVEDNVDPVAVCQPHTVQLDSGGNGSMLDSDINGGSTDACGIASLVASQTAFTCADVGVNNVTLTVTDNNGNSSQCVAQVTVEDNVDPAAVCQPHTVLLDGNGNGSMLDSDIDGGSTDACGIASVVASQTAFTCADVGVNNITLTVTDNNGNSSQCVAQVTVIGDLRSHVQTPTVYDLYEGDPLPGVMQTFTECGVPPYTLFEWYFDADGFGTGAPEALISNGLGGHPGDPAVTVTIGGVSPLTTLDLDAVSFGTAGFYRSRVTDSDAPAAVADSPDILLNVYEHLAIVTDLPSSLVVNNGDNGIGFGITTSGGIPPLDYDWFFDDGGGAVPLSDGLQVSGTTITGTDTDTLAFDEIHLGDAGDYYCVVTDNGTPEIVISNTLSLQVTNFMAATLPAEVRAYTGYSPLQLTADVDNGFPPYTMTWYEGANIVAGPTVGLFTLDLATADLADAGSYSVVVSDNSGGINPDVTSNTCILQVANEPTISVQPADVFVYEGESAIFGVVVVDGFPPYAYDWRLNFTSVGGPSIPGIITPPLPLIANGSIVDVVVQDQGVNQVDPNVVVVTDIFSAQATINVSAALVFDDHPADVSAYTDEPAFDLDAHFTGGMEPMTYVWKQDGNVVDGPTPVTTPNTIALTVDPSVEGPGVFDYNAEITDQVRTTSTNTAVVTLANHLTIDQDLVDADAINNQEFVWSISVSGGLGTVTYAWQKDDGTKAFQNLPEDPPRVTGTATNELTFDPALFVDAGTYRVEISDDFETVHTSSAVMSVRAGVPAVGVLGLVVLTLTSALSGAAALRRRRK